MPLTHKTGAALAITMGDAAGIGPEIIAKAVQEQPELLANCFVVGDVGTMRRAAKAGRPYPNLIDNMAASRDKK